MKKVVLLIITVISFNFANAQTKVIKANPLGLAFGIANAGYEFSTTDSQSLTVSGLYFNVSDITGVGLGAEYRFYFDGEAIQGWHAGPGFGYFSLKDNADTTASITSLSGEVGHQWIFGEHFALDLFAGYSYYMGGDELAGFEGGSTVGGLSIGYAW